jgi:site-specific DNA-methyltransferase (adenine-specific)
MAGYMMDSDRKDWATPKKLYENLNKEFNFDFDPCPINPEFNGLEEEWGKSNFINPPFGPGIDKWLQKGIEEKRKRKNSVFLLPARTDTKWFHELVLEYAAEVWFIKGRLCFDDCGIPAPFPCIIVVFNQTIVEGHTLATMTSCDKEGNII